MKNCTFLFIVILNSNFVVAQVPIDIASSDTCMKEEFVFYAPKGVEYRRDNEYDNPISFSVNIPEDALNFYYNNILFGFYYTKSERIFISTRIFDEDTSFFIVEKLSEGDAFILLNQRFKQFFEDSVYSSIHDFILDERYNYSINIDGNIILLLNILPVNIDCYLNSVRSFSEIKNVPNYLKEEY